MKLVSVFMDVEDPVNPRADDAALDVARLFTEAGVRGSFCITGEKCRTLMSRGRQDVIDAYQPHCLGLHTDTHSQHPTTMERLEKLPFSLGCMTARFAESKGLETFLRAFNKGPSFWGGAGNTWSAEISEALKQLGIPGYSYALTRLPGEPVHRYNGVLAFPQHLGISEPEWHADKLSTEATERVFQALEKTDRDWTGIFVGHPTKLRHKDYWDTPYFGGRSPAEPEFVEPVPDEDYERGKKNLSAFLHRLKGEFEVKGLDDVVTMNWTFRPPTVQELDYFEVETARAIRSAAKWPVHSPGLSAEKMVQKAIDLRDTVEVGSLA